MYYLMIENGNIIGASQSLSGGEIFDAGVSKELYDDYREHPNKYIAVETEIEVEIPDEVEEGEEQSYHIETKTIYMLK